MLNQLQSTIKNKLFVMTVLLNERKITPKAFCWFEFVHESLIANCCSSFKCHSVSYIHNKTDDTTNLSDACNQSQLKVIDVYKKEIKDRRRRDLLLFFAAACHES